MESQARSLTKFCDILHKSGYLKQKYVIPRSRLESIVKRDGEKRINGLAERRPQGLQRFRTLMLRNFVRFSVKVTRDITYLKCYQV